MNKTIEPDYLVNFKCIGGDCEDSCCIGWDVDIDQKTYQSYKNVSDPRMKKQFDKHIYENDWITDPNVDYAKVELTQDKKCPFLNADKLCIIQKHLGEKYLSNVCTYYPRTVNKVNGIFEMTLSPSCPEAARLILLNPESMKMHQVERPGNYPIITFDVDQRSKQYQKSLVAYFTEVRTICLDTMTQSHLPIEKRIYDLAGWVDRLQKLHNHKQTHQTPDVLSKFKPAGFEPSIFTSREIRDYSDNMVRLLLPVDSETYTLFTDEASRGDFELGEMIYSSYFSDKMHMLNNYFINLMVKNLFPFTEADQVWDAFMMLFTRFAIIKVQLIGIAGFRGELNDETVVAYIQSFSKVIEHHRTFVEKAVVYQKQNGFSKLSYIESAL